MPQARSGIPGLVGSRSLGAKSLLVLLSAQILHTEKLPRLDLCRHSVVEVDRHASLESGMHAPHDFIRDDFFGRRFVRPHRIAD